MAYHNNTGITQCVGDNAMLPGDVLISHDKYSRPPGVNIIRAHVCSYEYGIVIHCDSKTFDEYISRKQVMLRIILNNDPETEPMGIASVAWGTEHIDGIKYDTTNMEFVRNVTLTRRLKTIDEACWRYLNTVIAKLIKKALPIIMDSL